MRKLLPIYLLLCLPAWAEVDFNLEIRPILSEYCFSCHALDAKSGLRLDQAEGALKGGKHDGPAIVPGHPEKSSIFARIESDDPDDFMPPKGDRMKPSQISLLKKWVKEGAKYAEHWAYVKPQRAPLPKAGTRTAAPIDRFINAKRKELNLGSSEPADRATLLRRVYLDLVGLPPPVEEVDAFTADKSPKAYEKVVDRLLASPRYGEHWARQWLDLARYADSNGFQADQLRDSWAYRDWVINAMNSDMSFTQFTIEQIAGDLLPQPTLDSKIATGFHRTVTCNVEAGVHPEENRTNQVVDRVNTTGLVWLGVTLECAQCHDHKYDTFSQEEYYQIFSFFNNTPLEVENKSGKGVSFDFWGPKMNLPMSGEKQKQAEALKAQIAALKKKQGSAGPADARKKWEDELRASAGKPVNWQPMKVESFTTTGGATHELLKDGSILLTGTVPSTSVYTVRMSSELTGIRAFKLEALTHASLPGKGPGRGDTVRNNFVLNEFTAALDGGDVKSPIELWGAFADFSQASWDVAGAIDGNPKKGWAIAPQFSKPHWAVFQTREPVGDGAKAFTFTLDQNFGRGRVLGNIRISATTDDPTQGTVPNNIVKILARKKPSKTEKKDLDAYYAKMNPGAKKAQQQIEALQKKIDKLKPPSTLIMVEMDQKRETHLMVRGDYLNKGVKVSNGTPQVLHGWKDEYPNNRLGLAKWLVDADNPLVARVTVNRWWAQIMGRGIVVTEEDFGSQSEPPTHPELLDWLAVEFMENDWSMKHIHKTIVMSETYQQRSKVSPALLEADPANKYFARGPRHRMTAEMIRDTGLAISGLLSTKMAGPPVFPPQPDGLWRQTGRNEPKYVAATNEDRFRRGIYVIWRRAAPYPSFVNFDGPDRSACHPKRSRTNTPLQALTLMNDAAYVEMSLALAERVLKEKATASVDEQLTYAFRLAVSRAPEPAELKQLRALLEQETKRLTADKTAADELVKGIVGHKPDAAIDRSRLAAWFFIGNVLLNLDETITKG